jgi:hypothetical protein
MKIFLDRLGFVFHRPRFHRKTFTSVVIQAFFGGDDVVKYLDFVGGGIGFDVVKGACITGVEPQGERDRRKMDEALAALATRFHGRLSSPAPVPSLFRLWAFRWGRTAVARLAMVTPSGGTNVPPRPPPALDRHRATEGRRRPSRRGRPLRAAARRPTVVCG